MILPNIIIFLTISLFNFLYYIWIYTPKNPFHPVCSHHGGERKKNKPVRNHIYPAQHPGHRPLHWAPAHAASRAWLHRCFKMWRRNRGDIIKTNTTVRIFSHRPFFLCLMYIFAFLSKISFFRSFSRELTAYCLYVLMKYIVFLFMQISTYFRVTDF